MNIESFRIGKSYQGKRIGTASPGMTFKIINRRDDIVSVEFPGGAISDVKANYVSSTGSEIIFPEGYTDFPLIVDSGDVTCGGRLV